MTTSLEGLRAFEAQTPEFDRLIQRLASAVCRASHPSRISRTRGGPLSQSRSLPGPGGWKKIFKRPKPERGGARVVLKMSISIVVEVTNAPKTWG